MMDIVGVVIGKVGVVMMMMMMMIMMMMMVMGMVMGMRQVRSLGHTVWPARTYDAGDLSEPLSMN